MKQYGRRAFTVASVVLVLTSLVVPGAGAGAAWSAADSALTISTLANRADLISGPATVVQITLPAGATPEQVSVRLNGQPASDQFALRPNGKMQGLLTGLKLGRNVVSADLQGTAGAQLVITAHSPGGPVIAGPQVQPWFCNNQANGAGAPRDAQCNTDPSYSYRYKSSITGLFAAYDPAHPPLDVARTTTDHGVAMPYIVRVETGVLDRGIYQIAVLTDPAKPWAPWAPQPAWNGKIYHQFGGDCTPDHSQGPATALNGETWLDDYSLSRGFLDTISSNTVLGQNCNSVVSAETLMMIKEHVTNSYGPIRYTMSTGCSGGSMQQHWDVSNYPGLLDGIIPSCSFPDVWATMQEAEDCHLLIRVFATAPDLLVRQTSITGFAAPITCNSLWDNPTGNLSYAKTWLDPANGPGCLGGAFAGHTTLEPNPLWVYDPATNPAGVRCTLQDYQVSLFGRRPSDGFANRPFANIGVQYGLNAVNSGTITPQQFADLNSRVGGLDIDWNRQPQRSTADPAALTTAYRAGLVTYPAAAATVPIIDLRGAGDVEIHTDVHSYIMRARLDQANGTHANQVIWTAPGLQQLVPPAVSQAAFATMDQWLTAIQSDTRSIPKTRKVIEDKPGRATDSCWILGQQLTDQSFCRAAFPYYADPRIAAGGPLANNILQCRLKPLDPAGYTVGFTPAQWAELQHAFPTGVCDYRQPGVAQQPSTPWMSFAGGAGGQPLGPPPASTPITGL
ncbi:DUF6351 family protein [Streptomyces sp. MN03-5084-2B]|nr:DUF6351 family protein [Streptomyces sp. MN03-5084-2B]